MSDEIRQALERYTEAWQGGDRVAIAACYHDEFTLHYNGSNDLSGIHRGKSASLNVLAKFSERTRRRLVSIDDVAIGTGSGVVLARESLMLGDDRVEVTRVLVYRVEAGLLSECWVFDEDQDLIDRILTGVQPPRPDTVGP